MSVSGTNTGAPLLHDQVRDETWFKCEGQGEAVVCIHGVGLDHRMWEAQIAGLKDQFRVICYDMLGHGQSAHPPKERFLSDFVYQLHQLLIRLKLEHAALIGFSMGGLVARDFAILYPEMTSKLILINTVFHRSREQKKAVMARYLSSKNLSVQKEVDAAIDRWFTPVFVAANPDVIDSVRSRLLSNDPHAYLKAYKVFATATDPDAPLAISCPTLVMTGELDKGSTPQMTKSLANAIDGAKVEILPGLRHMTPVEGADRVNQVLAAFLDNKE